MTEEKKADFQKGQGYFNHLDSFGVKFNWMWQEVGRFIFSPGNIQINIEKNHIVHDFFCYIFLIKSYKSESVETLV